MVVGAVIVLLFAGCTGPGPDQSGSDQSGGPRAPGPAETTVEPSATPQSASPASGRSPTSNRPTQPVPDVRPDGMVDPPDGRGMARYRNQPVTWTDCSTEQLWLQCAEVLAPLDYENPGRAAVTLTMRRRPSPGGDPQGSLFVNFGGPGGSGVDLVAGFEPYGLQQRYDVIGWDPRGVGRSTPVQCFDDAEMETYAAADSSPDNPGEMRAWEELNKRFGQACLEHSGKLLNHISTTDTVRDLNLLRQLVGDPKLHYLGFSYGTSIGARYATMFPGRLGRLVLDGATNVGGAPETSQTDGFNRTLGNFAQWCAERNCRLGSSKQEVLDTIDGLLNDLDSDPLPAGRRDLTQALGVTGLIYALYSPEDQWPTLLAGLELAVFSDNGRVLLAWADRYYQRSETGEFTQFNAAFQAIRCADVTDSGIDGAIAEWRRVSKRAKPLGAHSGPDFSCPTWPVPSSGDQRRPIDYTGKPPVVIIGTRGDPATPYEYAEHMHSELESSRLITLRSQGGHLGFDQSACVRGHAIDYLMHEATPKRDVTCRQ